MNKSEIKKSEIVSFEIKNNIGILTIDNDGQNKIHKADFCNLELLKEWLSDEDLKGLIITGKGRHFSVGADVDNIRNCNSNEYLVESLRKGKEILNYIETLPLITVAAISGACFGAGFEIALSCQFRIMTENAILAFPESNIGIMPGLAGTYRLPNLIGKSKALEIIVSGRTVSSSEALELGICSMVVDKKQHIEAAIKYIEEMTINKSHHQINNIVKSVNNSLSKTKLDAMAEEGKMFAELVKNLKGSY